ncbi:MAG: hypothetical protein VB858_00175, partial [Planctomycetaceae bacterium]
MRAPIRQMIAPSICRLGAGGDDPFAEDESAHHISEGVSCWQMSGRGPLLFADAPGFSLVFRFVF